jgi:hypothetical protein
MAFHEVRFPTDISYGSSGGPEFSTDIVITSSGHEQRNITADFEFDVPVRFDTDRLSARLESYGVSSWTDIPLVEIRV